MTSRQDTHATTLRAWHLALLRFAVTREVSDMQAAWAIAAELDRLGTRDRDSATFGFFRRTTQELCAALLQPGEFDRRDRSPSSCEDAGRSAQTRLAGGARATRGGGRRKLQVNRKRQVGPAQQQLMEGPGIPENRFAIGAWPGSISSLAPSRPEHAFPAISVRVRACNGPPDDSCAAFRQGRRKT